MAYDAGIAFLQVVPSFRGVQQAITGQASKWGLAAGNAFADVFNDTVSQKTKNAPLGPSDPASRKQGDSTGGAFADGFKRRVEAALRSLPPAQIGAATTEADQKIKDLRAELLELSGKEIGVDITDAEALAKIEEIRVRLEELSESSPSVQTKVDTAGAVAQLAALQAEVDKVAGDRPTVTVDVDAGEAATELAAVDSASALSTSGLFSLMNAGIALGPAIIPVAGAAAAAVAGIGTAGIAGVAGLGVLALGLKGVLGAVSDMGAAQTKTAGSGASLAQRQDQIAGALDQVKNAEASLANTRANAAVSTVQAEEREQNAETSLAQAQAQAKLDQQALTQARVDAKQAIEDLNLQVADGALAQRQANLDQETAQKQLNAVLANPKSTQLQREQAQLTYDQAVQQVTDLAVRQQRLVDQQAAANKAGVDGSQQVLSAQQKIASSTASVVKAQQDLKDARTAEGTQARQSAFEIAQAEQGVISAQRALRDATIQTGSGGSAAIGKLSSAMAALSPAGRAFAIFLFGLKPLVNILSRSAETGLLPGLEAGIKFLLPVFPAFNRLVGAVALALGQIFEQGGKALTSPFWSTFFGFVASTIVPSLQILLPLLGNFAEGFAGLFQGFAPLSAALGGGLLAISQGFARFGQTAGAGKNNAVNATIAYIKENGPKVVGFFRDVFVVVGKLAVALAPLGALIVGALGGLARFLAQMSPGELIAIATGIAAIGIAIGIALDLNPITLIIAGITLLVGAVVYAWTHVATFRDIVLGVFGAVKTAALFLWHNVFEPAFRGIAAVAIFLWNNALKPIFGLIVAYIQNVTIPIVLFLWHNVYEPAFRGIAAIAIFLWNNALKPIFGLIVAYIQNVTIPIVLFLWHDIFEPAFKAIGVIVQIGIAIVKVALGLFEIYLKAVVFPLVLFLWHNIFEPAFKGIGAVIEFVWLTTIKPTLALLGGFLEKDVLPAFKTGVSAIGNAWKAVEDLAKTPIKFVVDTVLNNGIIKAYNFLAGKFGVSKVDTINLGFSRGGVVPGYAPRRDTQLAMVSPGESWMVPEWTRMVGGERVVHAMNQAAIRGQHFSFGGIVKNIGGAISTAAHDLTHPLDALKGLISAPLAKLNQITGSPFGQLIAGVPRRAAHDLIGAAKGIFGFDGGGLLQPGLNLAYHGIRTPDAVLSDSQWQAVYGAAQAGMGGVPRPRSALSIEHFHAAPNTSARGVAEELMFFTTARGGAS